MEINIFSPIIFENFAIFLQPFDIYPEHNYCMTLTKKKKSENNFDCLPYVKHSVSSSERNKYISRVLKLYIVHIYRSRQRFKIKIKICV